MAGHSKWAQIKRSKGINDVKRGAQFTKIGNMISVAARSGVDPDLNPNLALAIEKAKKANMPMSNVERAIKRASDKKQIALEEVAYEAYGPGGSALIIECATDNRNRTFPEIRTAVTKHGGRMAETGSVMFQFEKKAVFEFTIPKIDAKDELILTLLDIGFEDIDDSNDDYLIAYSSPEQISNLNSKVKLNEGLILESSELQFVAKSLVELSTEDSQKLERMMEAIEDQQDLVNVWCNF
jgi:YebC/PmpR family DNA-binding regulatory protein